MTYVSEVDVGCASGAEEHVQERDRDGVDGVVLCLSMSNQNEYLTRRIDKPGSRWKESSASSPSRSSGWHHTSSDPSTYIPADISTFEAANQSPPYTHATICGDSW